MVLRDQNKLAAILQIVFRNIFLKILIELPNKMLMILFLRVDFNLDNDLALNKRQAEPVTVCFADTHKSHYF